MPTILFATSSLEQATDGRKLVDYDLALARYLREWSSPVDTAAISSTAASKTSWLADDGSRYPLILRTN